ncbi:drug-responsive transcription factor pdr3 [Sarracenia purpurea var. burkii]
MELTSNCTYGSGRNIETVEDHQHASSSRSIDLDSTTEGNEEEELKWAAIERLPTFSRLRTSLFDLEGKKVMTDVTKLSALERHLFIEKMIKNVEKDNLRFLQKLRDRIDRVDVKLPTVEVRFKNLYVEAECQVVCGKPLPTLWNSIANMLSRASPPELST